ncbi:hypothetical protein [uncultured Methanomethylovorans sp.]|uniref:hypothetical protein n=1 Tax=uncultured Methanomethylovorans sp. TaxID=183759 RepID=UPI0026019736|nr:hypothetical protein [uncultured Methanomethylovorans sp.]
MYRWDPGDHTAQSSNQQHWAQELIQKLALKGNERILDIGDVGRVMSQLKSQAMYPQVMLRALMVQRI